MLRDTPTCLEERRFVCKSGLEVTLRKSRFRKIYVYELINESFPVNNYAMYIHGGPNLSCAPYLTETETGGFRSLENVLMHTNLLLVDQEVRLSIQECVSRTVSESPIDDYMQSLLANHGPAAQAEEYNNVINHYLHGLNYGLIAQSFGAQILLAMLDQLEGDSVMPDYIAFGSPFFVSKRTDTYLNNRRVKLRARTELMASFLKGSGPLKDVRQRSDRLNLSPESWHKIALTIAHPAHPVGVITKSLSAQLNILSETDDLAFADFFNVGEPDVLNFAISSNYFTPGSNIYAETCAAQERHAFAEWMPDEGHWLSNAWAHQYSELPILAYQSPNISSEKELDILRGTMASIPTLFCFDRGDFMVPVDRFLNETLPTLGEKAHVVLREGYGHWVGHSIIGRFIGGI